MRLSRALRQVNCAFLYLAGLEETEKKSLIDPSKFKLSSPQKQRQSKLKDTEDEANEMKDLMEVNSLYIFDPKDKNLNDYQANNFKNNRLVEVEMGKKKVAKKQGLQIDISKVNPASLYDSQNIYIVGNDSNEIGKEEDELRECTFKPQINPLSKAMAGYTRPLNLEDSIAYYQERREKKLEMLKQKYPKDVIKYSFQPEINKNSHQLINREEKDCYERLYTDAHRRDIRLNTLASEYTKDECPFQPNAKDVKIDNPQKAVKEFLGRYKQNLKRLDLNHNHSMGCERDKQYFNEQIMNRRIPKINASKEGSRGNSKKPVFSRLYEDGLEKEKRKRELQKSAPESKSSNRSQHHQSKNSNIFKQMMEKRYHLIFSLLDSDMDGLISSQDINVEALNVELVSVLSPMLFEIDDYSLVLNRSQFVKACGNLYSFLHYHGKTRLRNLIIEAKDEEQITVTQQEDNSGEEEQSEVYGIYGDEEQFEIEIEDLANVDVVY